MYFFLLNFQHMMDVGGRRMRKGGDCLNITFFFLDNISKATDFSANITKIHNFLVKNVFPSSLEF